MIFKLVDLNSQNRIMGGKKSVMYAIKRDVGYLDILKKSVRSQKINSRIDLVNILIKNQQLSILLTSKERSQVKIIILIMRI